MFLVELRLFPGQKLKILGFSKISHAHAQKPGNEHVAPHPEFDKTQWCYGRPLGIHW